MSDTLNPIGPEETDDPVYADERNFFKVEAWTADGNNIRALIYAGNRLIRRGSILRRLKSTARLILSFR